VQNAVLTLVDQSGRTVCRLDLPQDAMALDQRVLQRVRASGGILRCVREGEFELYSFRDRTRTTWAVLADPGGPTGWRLQRRSHTSVIHPWDLEPVAGIIGARERENEVLVTAVREPDAER
jgi:hypothetical protein